MVDALQNRLLHYMEIWYEVSLGAFGSFKPAFAVKVLEDADASMVKMKKVCFYLDGAFAQMQRGMSVESGSEVLDVKE